MKIQSVASWAVAAVLGVLYYAVTAEIWGYYAASEFSAVRWLVDTFGGESVLFWVGLYTHDLIVNLLLAAPFAAAFVVFRWLNNWPCVSIAVLLSVVTAYAGVEWSYFARVAPLPMTWMVWAMQLLSFPIAFVAIRAIRRRISSGTQLPRRSHGRAAA